MIFMKINLNDSWITLITFIHRKVKTLSLVLKDAKNYLNYKKMIWVAVVKDGEVKVVKVIMETKDFMEIITKVEIIIVVMMVVVEEATEVDLEVVNVVGMITDR